MVPENIRGVTTAHLVYKELPYSSPNLRALSMQTCVRSRSFPVLWHFSLMMNICTCEEGFEALGIFAGGRAADQLLGQEATSVPSLQIQHTQIPVSCN